MSYSWQQIHGEIEECTGLEVKYLKPVTSINAKRMCKLHA